MQIMGCPNDGDNATEIVFAEPNNFLLSTNSTVVGTESAWPFANCKFVLDDPGEVSGRDTKGPLAS